MNKLIFGILSILLAGCATRSQTIEDNQRYDFSSKRTPDSLAACIERNADDSFANALRAKISKIEGSPTEVLVRNADSIWAVVQISHSSTGSSASVYLGGVSTITPEGSVKLLIKGCDTSVAVKNK